MSNIIREVQINIPFTMLYESYLPLFLEHGINPEIGFDAGALDRFKISDFQRIAEPLHKAGLSITIHAPFLDLSPGSVDEEVRAATRYRFQQVCELLPVFGPKAVVCHTGWDHRRYWAMKATWIEKSREIWSWLSQEITAGGAVLVLENVYERDPQEFMALYEGLDNEGIGFCLDTGHLNVFGEAELSTWVQEMGAYITEIHLHDNLGDQDEHLALGRGEIDFEPLFAFLGEGRVEKPIVTLEPHNEEDAWPSLAFLEALWPW